MLWNLRIVLIPFWNDIVAINSRLNHFDTTIVDRWILAYYITVLLLATYHETLFVFGLGHFSYIACKVVSCVKSSPAHNTCMHF